MQNLDPNRKLRNLGLLPRNSGIRESYQEVQESRIITQKSENPGNWETKNHSKKPCLLDKYSQKARLKNFICNPEVTWDSRGAEGGLIGDINSRQSPE